MGRSLQCCCTSTSSSEYFEQGTNRAHFSHGKSARTNYEGNDSSQARAASCSTSRSVDICQIFTAHVNKIFVWSDSTTVLQWLNSKSKHPFFIANCVCEILNYTSVHEWDHVPSSNIPADARTRDMYAAVLQRFSVDTGPDLLRTKQFPFEPNSEVVNNTKLGIAIKESGDTSTSLAESATKSNKEPPLQLNPFDEFYFYQILLRITRYVL